MGRDSKVKNQKGSISLFVLLSALFFLVMVTSVGVNVKNKEVSVNTNYQQIKAKYEQDIGNEERVYQEKKNEQSLKVAKLIVDPNGGTWMSSTNKSTITQSEEDQITLESPIPPSVRYDADGGTTDKTSESLTFDKWELTGVGTLNGMIYHFGNGTGTVTAKYNSIKLPSATKDGYNFARMV